jgi:transcriptional regulator with XRE-family HTH domain
MPGNLFSKKTRVYTIDIEEELAMPPKRDLERAPNSDPERDYLAQRLREAREYLGLSQVYVSQQTKIPRPAISEAEAGRRKVESLELRKLAALYGRPLSYFLPGQEAAGLASPETREFQPGAVDQTDIKLRGLTKDLPAEDREEIVRFAEYLRHKKLASQTSRRTGGDKTP